MGLFKNRKDEVMVDMTPTKFYQVCLDEFFKEAAKYGVAKRRNIFVPELALAGKKIVLTFLQDNFLLDEYGNDPLSFYHAVTMFVWESGLVFAAKWHEEASKLDTFVDIVGIVGPADDADKLLKAHFPASISQNQGDAFLKNIYSKLLNLHEPYWKLSDCRQYTFYGMLAAYQLAVSMMLEKLGY